MCRIIAIYLVPILVIGGPLLLAIGTVVGNQLAKLDKKKEEIIFPPFFIILNYLWFIFILNWAIPEHI